LLKKLQKILGVTFLPHLVYDQCVIENKKGENM